MRLPRGSDDGATVVVVALTMVVLVGFVALAIDGGVVYNERRSTHNAADHAALAAAWAACNGNDPQAAGVEAAQQNGYIATEVNIANESGNRYRATVTAVEDTNVAQLIGTDEVTVVSEAVADCTSTGGLGGFALFAGAPASCGGQELSTPGASLEVNGGAHSNGDFHSPGPPSGKDWNGPVTYALDGTLTGGQFHQGATQTPMKEYPVPEYWVLESYEPGGDRALAAGTNYYPFVGNQNWTSSDIDEPGLYYVDGSVHITNVDNDDVTIVATENIHIAGSSNRLTPYESDGLLLFSNHDAPDPCGEQVAVHFAAATNTHSGVIYAPDGQCRKNNAASFALNGSIICGTINLAGAGVEVTYIEDFGGDPSFTVELTE